MLKSFALCLGLLAVLPTAASAACEPGFADNSNSVRINPSPNLDDGRIVDRFEIRVRNSGDEVCSVRLGVSRDLAASDSRFPTYELSGPSGAIPLASLTAPSATSAGSTAVVVPAGEEISVPFVIRTQVGWGSEAGTFSQQLIFTLQPEGQANDLKVQRTGLVLDVPSAARIRFAGAQGSDGPGMLDMGQLSQETATLSPPFAIRVLSTAGYQMQLVSQNGGSLVRQGSSERIPYDLSIGGRRLRMEGGGDEIRAGRHTSSAGDVHPVSIVIKPDPNWHAGDYSDRVTVTVSSM